MCCATSVCYECAGGRGVVKMWFSVATVVSVLGVAAVYSELEISDLDKPSELHALILAA